MQWLTENRDILFIALVAFVFRLTTVGVVHEQGYTSDEKEYISLATKLADGKEFVDTNGEWSTKAPLWPFIVSLLFRLFGSGLYIPHLINCLLGTLSVYLVFKLCLEIFEKRFVALISAALVALYPSLIVYSDILQTETLYIVFVLATLLFVERIQKRPTVVNALMLGSFAAGATLTRAVFIGFFPLILLIVAWLNRQNVRRFLPALLIALFSWCLVLAPWTIRNFNVHEKLIPVSSWGGISLLLGNNPYSTGTWSSKPGFQEWFEMKASENGIDLAQSNEIQRSELGRKLAIEFIVSEPAAAAALALKKFYIHWVYPISNSDSNTRLQVICVVGDVILYTLAGLGFLIIAGTRVKLLSILTAICFFTLLQVVMHCEARYRLPVMPLIAMLSASGLALLLDKDQRKTFSGVRRNRVLASAWVTVVGGVYSFTAWQFLSGKI